VTGRRFSKRTMAERRVTWREDVGGHPAEWDLAYSWVRAELADLRRSRKRSLRLRIRTAGLANGIQRDAVAHLLGAKDCLERSLPARAREHPGYPARRAEFEVARTPDERMWNARNWLTWYEEWADFAERDRALLTARLAGLAERIGLRRGDR
jgi:hypothetical protein